VSIQEPDLHPADRAEGPTPTATPIPTPIPIPTPSPALRRRPRGGRHRSLYSFAATVALVTAVIVAITAYHHHSERAGAESRFLASPLVTALHLDRDTALDLGYQACDRLTPATRKLSREDDAVTFAAKLWLCGR
jgi:hypothetical protein